MQQIKSAWKEAVAMHPFKVSRTMFHFTVDIICDRSRIPKERVCIDTRAGAIYRLLWSMILKTRTNRCPVLRNQQKPTMSVTSVGCSPATTSDTGSRLWSQVMNFQGWKLNCSAKTIPCSAAVGKISHQVNGCVAWVGETTTNANYQRDEKSAWTDDS